jgi:putative protease
VIADFHDLRQYSAAVEAAHAAGARIALATPRIQKPGEIGVFRALARHGADAILARNLAAMAFFRGMGPDILADFSLNATNELTVAWLRRQGARRVTASYDLDRDQLLDLAAAATPEALEVVVYQHMPMFHMEHCVFCAALSPGTNKTDCGRPCDRHEVRLRDHVGMEHPLRADAGCRNTLFNAQPQSAAEIVPLLQERGVRHFRVELLDDAGDEPGVIVSLYRGLLVAFPPRPGHNERTV